MINFFEKYASQGGKIVYLLIYFFGILLNLVLVTFPSFLEDSL